MSHNRGGNQTCDYNIILYTNIHYLRAYARNCISPQNYNDTPAQYDEEVIQYNQMRKVQQDPTSQTRYGVLSYLIHRLLIERTGSVDHNAGKLANEEQ
jgi:hypothetical protein